MANCGGCQYGNFPPPGMVPGVPTGGGRCNKGHGNFKSMWDPACKDFVQKGFGGAGSDNDGCAGCLVWLFELLKVLFKGYLFLLGISSTLVVLCFIVILIMGKGEPFFQNGMMLLFLVSLIFSVGFLLYLYNKWRKNK